MKEEPKLAKRGEWTAFQARRAAHGKASENMVLKKSGKR